MPSSHPSYVEAKEHLRVLAWMRGFPVEAVALGWTGDRVHIRWSDGPGLNHLGWVPAADVERQKPPDAAAPRPSRRMRAGRFLRLPSSPASGMQ